MVRRRGSAGDRGTALDDEGRSGAVVLVRGASPSPIVLRHDDESVVVAVVPSSVTVVEDEAVLVVVLVAVDVVDGAVGPLDGKMLDMSCVYNQESKQIMQ